MRVVISRLDDLPARASRVTRWRAARSIARTGRASIYDRNAARSNDVLLPAVDLLTIARAAATWAIAARGVLHPPSDMLADAMGAALVRLVEQPTQRRPRAVWIARHGASEFVRREGKR